MAIAEAAPPTGDTSAGINFNDQLSPDKMALTGIPAPVVSLVSIEIVNTTAVIGGYASPGADTSSITSIRWDWGDEGSPEFHSFPSSHTYRKPGNYTLAVTAYQSDGQRGSAKASIRINQANEEVAQSAPIETGTGTPSPPGPGPSPGVPVVTLLEPVIERGNVTLNGNLNSGSPVVTISSVSLDWNDGNITTTTDLPATHEYDNPGIYTINVTAVQSDGQTVSKRITVDIRGDQPGPPGDSGPKPPPGTDLTMVVLLLAGAIIVSGGVIIGLRTRHIVHSGLDEPDIPREISAQEEMYYAAREKGDTGAAAASARVCAKMFRSSAEKNPKKRHLYLELAEKWDLIAQGAGSAPGTPRGPAIPDTLPSEEDLQEICQGTDVNPRVLDSVVRVAWEIAREGREGQAVGTSFVVGDTGTVMTNSRQFVLNPFHGHSEGDRQITDIGIRGNIKEFAQLDGAFIVSGTGVVEAAGRYITVDMGQVQLPEGLGSRHSSIAGITLVTRSIGIVVSQSGGMISVFKDGRIVHTVHS